MRPNHPFGIPHGYRRLAEIMTKRREQQRGPFLFLERFPPHLRRSDDFFRLIRNQFRMRPDHSFRMPFRILCAGGQRRKFRENADPAGRLQQIEPQGRKTSAQRPFLPFVIDALRRKGRKFREQFPTIAHRLLFHRHAESGGELHSAQNPERVVLKRR